MNTRATQYAGRAAILVGIAGIVSLISLALFFGIEAPKVSSNPNEFYFWGFVSDVSAPATMLPLLVVMFALHQAQRAQASTLSRVALTVGVIGALGVTILQLLLIVRVLSFEQEVGPVTLAMGIVGAWLLLASNLALAQRTLRPGLSWLGIVIGAAQCTYPLVLQMLGGADFYSQVGSNYLAIAIVAVVVLLSYVGFPIWAFWFASQWSSTRMKANAEVVYAR